MRSRKLARLASECACRPTASAIRCLLRAAPSIIGGGQSRAPCRKESIRLNIVLPHEQAPMNMHAVSEFQFHYFALRKMPTSCCGQSVRVSGARHADEFSKLSRCANGKWKSAYLLFANPSERDQFDALAEKARSAADLNLFQFVEKTRRAYIIQKFYRSGSC